MNRGHTAAQRGCPRIGAPGAGLKYWFWVVVGSLAILLTGAACAAPATRESVAPPAPAAATATPPAATVAKETAALPTLATANATAVPRAPTAAKATAAPFPPLTSDDVPRISAEELKAQLDAGAEVLIVDVRSAEAYSASHIMGALSLPSAELENRLQELPMTQDIVTYCT
jgi:hypothetical protein